LGNPSSGEKLGERCLRSVPHERICKCAMTCAIYQALRVHAPHVTEHQETASWNSGSTHFVASSLSCNFVPKSKTYCDSHEISGAVMEHLQSRVKYRLIRSSHATYATNLRPAQRAVLPDFSRKLIIIILVNSFVTPLPVQS
jgi:hypothetical protein